MKNPNKQGFTLVELSIVLVIIGLLIGGILAAQSMITTTKIQAFARQIGQFDAAVVNFQDKFGGLPGDRSPNIGGADVGDNNGLITSGGATWADEIANFWVMLQTSGFKSEDGATYLNTAPAAGLDKDHSPQGKAGSKTSFFASGDAAATAFGGGSANAYVSASCTTGTATLACTAGFSGPDAIAIDTKLDDGKGDSGNVVGAAVPAVVDVVAPLTGAATAYVINATPSNPTASLVIRMGNAAGNPL